MHKIDDEVHVEDDEARGGSTPGIVRWVLLISLVLAIGALSIIWITGALRQNPEDRHSSVDAQIDQAKRNDTAPAN